jgi:ribosomal silencing factor RsfS
MSERVSYNPEEYIFDFLQHNWEIGEWNDNSPMMDGRKPHMTHDWEAEGGLLPSLEIFNDQKASQKINLALTAFKDTEDVRVVVRSQDRREAWQMGHFIETLAKENAKNLQALEGYQDNDWRWLDFISMNRVVEYSIDTETFFRYDIVLILHKAKTVYTK